MLELIREIETHETNERISCEYSLFIYLLSLSVLLFLSKEHLWIIFYTKRDFIEKIMQNYDAIK